MYNKKRRIQIQKMKIRQHSIVKEKQCLQDTGYKKKKITIKVRYSKTGIIKI